MSFFVLNVFVNQESLNYPQINAGMFTNGKQFVNRCLLVHK